jgi:hypothetical protein
MSGCNFPDVPEVCGRFAVIAHTPEGEFVYSRYDSAASRDTAFSIANAELLLDKEMLASGANYTIGFSDEVIRFSKRTDPIEELVSLV